jgi:hypothetical protein
MRESNDKKQNMETRNNGKRKKDGSKKIKEIDYIHQLFYYWNI